MRSVTGTARSMFGASAAAANEALCAAVLLASTGPNPAMTAADAVPPVVNRNSRRVRLTGSIVHRLA
jgi:hypothetical protein